MTKWFTGLVLLFVLACNSGKQEPGNLIPVDKTKKIFWDLMLADQYAAYIVKKDSTRQVTKEKLRLYNIVFQSYQVSAADYSGSINYYMANPTGFKVMYDSMINHANEVRFKPRDQKVPATTSKP